MSILSSIATVATTTSWSRTAVSGANIMGDISFNTFNHEDSREDCAENISSALLRESLMG